ncbi:MAG: hypothetical protein JWN26_643 [Candidatus Saccharibacteria bacterium]|nr:hypothetical protein [Candidatus Saccharibacteria bacterium]
MDGLGENTNSQLSQDSAKTTLIDSSPSEVLFNTPTSNPSNLAIFLSILKGPWTKRRIIITSSVIVAIALMSFFFLKTSLAITPIYTRSNQIVNKPFIIEFNETVRPVAVNEIKISPAVDGSWSFKSGNFFNHDEIIFTPKTYFRVSTTYKVTVPNAKRLLIGDASISNIAFTTEKAPSLANSGIDSVKSDSTVAADYAFTVELAAPNKQLRTLELRTNPDIPMAQTVENDTKFTWKPTKLLPQGTTVSVQVYDAKNDVVLATKTLKIAPEPEMTTPVKKDYFSNKDIATITFNQPMDPLSSKYITFSTPGQGSWQSNTVYAFTPDAVAAGQTYTYTLGAGLRSQSGGILAADQSATFSTTGPVTITDSSPHGSLLPQASEQVSFTFDQAVDHASVLSHFAISSGKVTGSSWQGNTFIATVTDLGYQQTVTATLTPGILNSGFGLPSTKSFSSSFTTEIRVVRLNIPYYNQQYAATCAAASLRMVLAYRGITTDDMAIINQMGYNPTVENKTTNPPTWDDPQQMFVGSVNGTIGAGTGAGPDAQPVAKAAIAFGRSATAVTDSNVSWIAQQLYNGNPVIFFGAYSNTSFTSWQTPSGRIERMNLTSHARVVTGFKGEPSNPIGFWVSDPIDGSSYWTAAQVTNSINLDAYDQAVVVY